MKTKPTPPADSITVSSVEITIAGTKLHLTMEQVKELKQKLAEAFPEPVTKTITVPGPERVVFRDRYNPPATWLTPAPWKESDIICASSR